MIRHILALKASADLPTWNLKCGNVQAVVTGQQQTPTSTLLCRENAESAQVMVSVDGILAVQRQRHVQRRARLAVSVVREGLQTLAKSRLEHQHQTLPRKLCQLLDLSDLQDHDDAFRGIGLPQHYRVHPKEPALQLVTQPSSLKHSTKMRMLLSNP